MPQLSIVMPCLNEAATLADCITAAQAASAAAGISAEIIVADNGSTDGSQQIALGLGARVIKVSERGYGNALRGGIAAAEGRYIVIGDADRSYDFGAAPLFLEKLSEGFDLVMGNRFAGGIEPGAMPWLNRWVGTPVIGAIGRLMFRTPARDFNCGFRGFSREAYNRMNLQSAGMEFASEMVIKAAVQGMRTAEVPVVLRPDGRTRAPHLRRWRDGWRHLRFMLLFSPRWLFLVPGCVALAVGAAVVAWLFPGPRQIGAVELDIDTMLVAGVLAMIGYQLVVFAVFSKVYAIQVGFHPGEPVLERLFKHLNLERGLLVGLVMSLAGLIAIGAAAWSWRSTGFGHLDPRLTMRELIPSVVILALGVQTIFASFFLSILGIDRGPDPAAVEMV